MTDLVYILDLGFVDCCTRHSDTGWHNSQAGMTVLALDAELELDSAAHFAALAAD